MAKAKSTKKTTAPLKERAVRVALDLAANQGWAGVSMEDVAKACKCTSGELKAVYEDRNDILAAYGRQIDKRVADNVSIDIDSPERDRLFDVLMERFDVIGEDREAVVSILQSFCSDPKSAVVNLPYLGRSMFVMLEAAEISGSGPRGAATVLGLVGVYLYTLKIWQEDESADLSKTMAALDRALGRAEQIAGLILR